MVNKETNMTNEGFTDLRPDVSVLFCICIWAMGEFSVSLCEISEGIPTPPGRKVEKMRNIVTQGWPPRNHLDELVKDLKKQT